MNHYEKQYIQNYNKLLTKIKTYFDEEANKIVDSVKDLNDTTKLNNGKLLCELLNEELFDGLLKSKVKIFSSKEELTNKVSNSLFGEKLSLKMILNNKTEEIKKNIWFHIHTIVLLVELNNKERNNDRITKLTNLLGISEKYFDNETKLDDIKNILGSNANQQTNDMINDIFSTVTGSLSSGANMSNIMSLTKDIAGKYANKMESGEIQLDKIMESLTNLPGVGPLLKGGLGNLGNLATMFNNNTQNDEPVIIDENFSTDLVQVGQVDESKPNAQIGSMLKMADSFGLVDNVLGSKDGNQPGIMGLFSNLKNLKLDESSSMEDILQNPEINNMMEKFSNPENHEELKQNIDSMMANMGIDMSQIMSSLQSINPPNLPDNNNNN